MRPATLYWNRDAALSRLTRVLPSSSAKTLLSSSATLSNSASKSSCFLMASSIFCAAGASLLSGGDLPLPASVVTAKVSRGFEGLLFLGGLLSVFFPAGCCCDSWSTTLGTADCFFSVPGFLPPGLPGATDRISPTMADLLPDWFAAICGAWDACLSKSATEGMRLPAMSLRICSISAHFSRWPTPNSGLRVACWTRSSPVRTRFDKRRPLAHSAEACVSMRRRVSGRSSSLRREGAELFVRFEQLHLAVANFQRLAMPLVQLFRQPDGVLLGVQHIQEGGRRVDPFAVGKIILHKDASPDQAAARCSTTWPRMCRRRPATPCRFRLPPGSVHPCAGFVIAGSSIPSHSMPTRFTPKSSRA